MNIDSPTASVQEHWIFSFNSDSEYLVQQMLFQMVGNIRCFDWRRGARRSATIGRDEEQRKPSLGLSSKWGLSHTSMDTSLPPYIWYSSISVLLLCCSTNLLSIHYLVVIVCLLTVLAISHTTLINCKEEVGIYAIPLAGYNISNSKVLWNLSSQYLFVQENEPFRGTFVKCQNGFFFLTYHFLIRVGNLSPISFPYFHSLFYLWVLHLRWIS